MSVAECGIYAIEKTVPVRSDAALLEARMCFAQASVIATEAMADVWRVMDRLASALADLERKDDAYRAAHLAAVMPSATPIPERQELPMLLPASVTPLPTSDVVSPPVQVVPVPMPPLEPSRFRYGPGELRASVLAIFRSRQECSVKAAFACLQDVHPETKMDSVRASIFDLVTEGYLCHGEQRGVYRVAEPKRPLSMVQ